MRIHFFIYIISFLCMAMPSLAQEEEETKITYCQEIDNKKAIKLFEKATNKKKI